MNKLLVFDLDGTLINSSKDIAIAINYMREKFGHSPLDLDTVVSYIGDGAAKLVERAIAGLDIEFEDAKKIYLGYYEEHFCVETTLYPDVISSLKKLKSLGYKLAVLTNKPFSTTQQIATKLSFAEYFDEIWGDGSGFPLKPNPASISALIEKFNADKKYSYMIGDHHTDIKTGINVGVDTIFVTHGLGNTGDVEPTHIVNNFNEILEILL